MKAGLNSLAVAQSVMSGMQAQLINHLTSSPQWGDEVTAVCWKATGVEWQGHLNVGAVEVKWDSYSTRVHIGADRIPSQA